MYLVDSAGRPRAALRLVRSPSTSASSRRSSPARSCAGARSCTSSTSSPTSGRTPPSVLARADAPRRRPRQEGLHRRPARAHTSKPVFQAAAQGKASRSSRPGRRRSASRSRSISTSPATPTWRSASRCCSASCCRRISTCPIAPIVAAGFLAPLAHDAVALPARLPLHPARRQPARPGRAAAGALFATMALGGLWHGAGLTFVAWGVAHGLGLGAGVLWRRAGLTMPAWLGWALTFVFVVLAWVLVPGARRFERRSRVYEATVRLRAARVAVSSGARSRSRRRSPCSARRLGLSSIGCRPWRWIAVAVRARARDRAVQDRRRCELRVHLFPVLTALLRAAAPSSSGPNPRHGERDRSRRPVPARRGRHQGAPSPADRRLRRGNAADPSSSHPPSSPPSAGGSR